MGETKTNHPWELGKVGKGIWRRLTVVHDLIAQQEVKPGISLHPPTALTLKYSLVLLNVPTSVFSYLLIYNS